MSVLKRLGAFGTYYGTDFFHSASLSESQMETNALYILQYLRLRGWTINAISGMLGNMQAESSLNPGRWQSEDVGNKSGGYGLVQWTPASNYLDWCGSLDASEMDTNLSRIEYELQNHLQYYPTDDYPETFEEFTKSTKSPEYLAIAFLKNYERAGVEVAETRKSFARKWYKFLNGESPTPTPSSSRKKKKFKFYLFTKRRLRNAKR